MYLLLAVACVRPVPVVAPAAPRVVAPHGVEAVSIRDALLVADLDRARAAFAALARGLDAVPGDAAARSTAIATATTGSQAPDDFAAARALGELGVACGSCHAAERATIARFMVPVVEGDGVRAEMARHDRALGIAWSGLIRADAAEIASAAAALQASNLSLMTRPTPAGATAMDDAVTAAGEALAMAAPEERGARFGGLLSACAQCHTMTPLLQAEPD